MTIAAYQPTRRQLIALAAALLATPSQALAGQAKGVASQDAPLYIDRVALRARDAESLAAWYERVLGLTRIPQPALHQIHLGAAGKVLLEIHGDPSLHPARKSEAGLYHTAFLLPSRSDFARWIRFAIEGRIPVDGVADHLVSEAVYLTDPEGNGVEICTDRDPSLWEWQGDQVQMGTEALDVDALWDLSDLVPTAWTGAPKGTVIGHVHLKVGQAEAASNWWVANLGMTQVRARESAAFLSTGGYHHHIAVNTWESNGAAKRDPLQAGLAFVQLASHWPIREPQLLDPWGTLIRVIPAPSRQG